VSRSNRATVGAYELDQRNPPRDEIKHRGVAGLLSQLARIHPGRFDRDNVWAMNFWSSPNARSAAFMPAASPSKVKITSR